MKNYFERQSLPYKATSIFILVVSIALIGTAAGYRLLRLPDNSLLLSRTHVAHDGGVYVS